MTNNAETTNSGVPSPERLRLIAGPCSAETEAQLRAAVAALSALGVRTIRAGIWKPRSRPNSFEGQGNEALSWLSPLAKEFDVGFAVEVGSPEMAEAALEADVQMVWLGARTTVNPFSVQQIADALRGTDVSILVKNPVNPDLALWMGALERLNAAAPRELIACHRGFSYYGTHRYRNLPNWEIPLELRRRWPELPLFCDPSHIGGQRALIPEVSQKALDLGLDGLMVEVHPEPENAWSDAAQQLTPEAFAEMLQHLNIRRPTAETEDFQSELERLRTYIDDIDSEMITLLARRMAIAQDIGQLKTSNNVAYFQLDRWREVLNSRLQTAENQGLSPEFIQRFLELMHIETIRFHDTAE